MVIKFTGLTNIPGKTLIRTLPDPPPEPIDFFKATETTKATIPSTSLLANVPVTVVEDDLMILYHVTSDDVTQSITPPGWTVLWQNVQVVDECTTSCYRKIAGAAEPLTVQVNSDSSEQHVAIISTFGGVNATTPINAFNNASNGSASTTVVAPSVITTQGSTMLYVLGATGGFPEPGDLDPDHWDFVGGVIERGEGNTSMDGAQSTLDFSSNAYPLSFINVAQLDTASKQSGNASLLLDGGINVYVSVPVSTSWDFGTADFTLEAHVNITANTNFASILGRGSFNDTHRWNWVVDQNGNLEFWHSSNQRISSSVNLASLGWVHVAVSRNSGTTRMYVSGVQVGVTGISMNITAGGVGQVLQIGKDPEQSVRTINGHIDNVRISKGVGRYPIAFSPPAGPLSNDGFVELLVPFDEPVLPFGAKAAVGTEFIPFATSTGTRVMTIDKAQAAQSGTIAITRQL